MQEDLAITKIFDRVAQENPDKIALQIKDTDVWRRFTYKEVENYAKKVGAYLLSQGYQKGDCATLVLENCPEWGIIYLGIMYAGLTCVAIDFDLSPAELNNLFLDCQPVIIFTSQNIYQSKLVNTKYPGLNPLIVDSEDFRKIETQPIGDISWPEVLPSDTASLIYTSGTTAIPKGVVLTHSNFTSNFRSIEKLNICLPSDNFLAILPLYHTYAFMVTLLVPLLLGAKVTYAKTLKPEDLTRIIKEADITILTGVPQLFSLIHKAIFEQIKKVPPFFRVILNPVIRHKVRQKFGKSLRLFASGGARLDPKVGKDLWGAGLKLIEGYGLTETSPVVTFNPLSKPRFGSVGRPLPDVQVRINNPDKSGIGEVFIKGANVMQGYFKHPDLTAQVKTEDGWFNSQDLGCLDKDGYLYLSGRKNDVIVLSSGKNIYPEELEEYYRQSPYIKEICILEKAEERFGQKTKLLFAVVVPDLEYFRKNNEINIQGKIHWELENLASNLPPYKRIMGFVITKEEFPRTHLKKIKRYEVARKYLIDTTQNEITETELSAEDKSILNSEVGGKVIKYMAAQLKRKVNLDSHLQIDLGIDSLGGVELALGLESLLGIKIPKESIENIFTVKEVILTMQRLTLNKAEASAGKQGQKTWSQILSESPPQEVLKKITLNSGFWSRIIIGFFKNIIWGIFRLFWSLKISGREFIPEKGPYVFCSNHGSYLDGFALFASIPAKCAANLFFIGHAGIFEHPVVRFCTIKISRLISIDTVEHLTEALQAASFVLGHKKIICLFPEGSRSIDSNVQEFKKGIGTLAKELNMPVVPVYIAGSHLAWPRTRRFPKIYPLSITFGKPVYWKDVGNDYASVSEGLREEVLKLKKGRDR